MQNDWLTQSARFIIVCAITKESENQGRKEDQARQQGRMRETMQY